MENKETVYVICHVGNHVYYYTRDLAEAEKGAKKYHASIKSYSSLEAALANEPYLEPLPEN